MYMYIYISVPTLMQTEKMANVNIMELWTIYIYNSVVFYNYN